MITSISRRDALKCGGAIVSAAVWKRAARADEIDGFRLATFQADVTPRLGHPLLGSHFAPARSVDDPLLAKGVILFGSGQPIVLVAIDWCEVRNDAYARWRTVLAEAAGTTPERVLVASVHQHDAPLADLTAQRLLDETNAGIRIIDLDFHERMVQRVAGAVRESLAHVRRVTHYGLGQARVERVASNRRVVDAQGRASFSRYSATRDAAIRDLPEGLIDPWLKAISFWDDDQPLAVLHAYATHPMSHYGAGAISSDFVGLAREHRQQAEPGAMQIYFSGCSGDVTAGKYNDGATENRQRLAERIEKAMLDARETTTRHPLMTIELRSAPLVLPHREGDQTVDALRARLADASQPAYARALAAMGLSSRVLHPPGHAIGVTALDFGAAQIVLLPAESLVGYQLLAQRLRSDMFVMAIGYGECAPGYIPTDDAEREGYVESQGWSWVAPGSERRMTEALRRALQADR